MPEMAAGLHIEQTAFVGLLFLQRDRFALVVGDARAEKILADLSALIAPASHSTES